MIRVAGITRSAAILLAALAMAVRIMLPSGYMPGATASGAPTIIICSGSGPLAMSLPMSPDRDHHDHDKAEHPCAFAATAAPAELPAATAPLLALQAEAVVATRAITLRPGHGLAAPPPPKTGPPPLI